MSLRALTSVTLAIVACSVSLALAVSPASDVSFDRSDVEIVRERAFERVLLDGCMSLSREGEPAMPVRIMRFVIPQDARVDEVMVSGLTETQLEGEYRVLPAQREVPTGERPVWTEPDAAIYGSDKRYPANRVEYLGDGYLGGYHVVSVAVHPLQYYPLSGRLILASDVSLELKLVAGTDRSHPRARVTERSDETYRRLVETLVENPEDVSRCRSGAEVVDDAEMDAFLPRFTPSLEGSPVEYVVITTPEFEPYFQDLVDWKTKKGVPTAVRTVPWINANYPGGTDTAERIRFFIQDAYESWGATYILLGGDTGQVPVRYAWSTYSGGSGISTDLYYSDLDGNWNLDGDYRYGEGYAGLDAPGDSIDLYPDVFVGRASCGTAIEVETFVDKTIAYEKTADADFASRDLFLAEVLFPYDWEPGDLISTDGAAHVVEPLFPYIPNHIDTIRIYQNYEPFLPGAIPLNAQTAIDSIEAGFNITTHVGHGSKDILRTSNSEYITPQDADALANGLNRSGFMWMLNCTSTAIEYDCISEHFFNNPNGGATFIYGATRFCFPTTAKNYLMSWYQLIHSGAERAGVASAMCKVPYVPGSGSDNTNRWTQMSFLLLGDPESMIWTDEPVALSVIHSSSVPLGPVNLFVAVADPAAVDSAYVCVVKDGEVYATAYTDPAGQANLSFTPKTTGPMTITVTAKNHYPYEDTIGVTSSSGAHLSLRDSDFDDDALGTSDGNANGVAEAGETVEVDVLVGNGGLSDATGVTATLSTTDTNVTLIDSTQYLGNVLASTQVAFDGAFAVEVSSGCPNGHDVEFTVLFEEASRTSWTSEMTLRVSRPSLVQRRNVFDDGDNGIPEVGETVVLTVDVLNDGNGDADLVSGVLRNTSGEVTITDSTDTWGDIAARATVTGQSGFEFTVDSGITSQFELRLTDEDGKIWSHFFDVFPPGQPENLTGKTEFTTIFLTWDPDAFTHDRWGFNVYRKDHEFGAFSMINDAVVEEASYYEDAGLEENKLYYYYVAEVDTSGNEGPASETLEVATNPPSQAGWPLMVQQANFGTPAVADVDLDGDLEILLGADEIYCWNHDGVELIDGDGDPRTEGILAAQGTGGYRASIAVGEMDGDPYPEIVCAAWANVGEVYNEYEVYAWNAEDGSVLPGWPVITGRIMWATPALADLDHDGLDEVILTCADKNLYCWRHDGTELIDGDSNPATYGVFAELVATWNYASPAVFDIDGDQDLEIVATSRSGLAYCFNPDGSSVPGWPVALGGESESSACAGDVNGDGAIEVCVSSSNDEVKLLAANGTLMSGWPKTIELGGDMPPSPTMADLNGDGELEIIQPGSNGRIEIWTWEGATYPGWPQQMADGSSSTASVGNIDDDADLEILVGCDDGKVYAFNTDGSSIAGWPIQTTGEVYCTPTLADVDDDGDVEVLLAGYDLMVYVWDTTGNYDGGDGVEWASFRGNYRRNGFYGYEEPVGVPEDDVWSLAGARLEQNTPNPFNPVTRIEFTVPEGTSEVDLAVYNVAGERVTTLAGGAVTSGAQYVVWDGTGADRKRVASGIYFVRLRTDETTLSRKMVLLK
jgi:hypothetical protein